MKIDRGLMGVLGIAVVLSTLVTLSIIGGKLGVDVDVLRNEFPPTMTDTGQEYSFTLSVITTRPLEAVGIRCNTLERIELSEAAFRDPVKKGDTVSQTLYGLAKLGTMLDQVAYLGVEVDSWNGTMEWRNLTRTHRYDMYVYDFTDLVWLTSPDNLGLGFTTTYVVCLDPEAHSVSHYFEGVSDFFFNRVRDITDLALQNNNQIQHYRPQAKIQSPGEGWNQDAMDIVEAPMYGTVGFESLEREDRISIAFSVKPETTLQGPTIPIHSGMLQLIRIYKNHQLETLITNFINPDAA